MSRVWSWIKFPIMNVYGLILLLIRKVWGWRWIRIPLMTAVLFGAVLLYEWKLDSYEISHGYLLAAIFIVTLAYRWLRSPLRWLIDFLGLEKEHSVVKLEGCIFGGFIISIYLLLSSEVNLVPPVLQFSIIPVTAMLGGLVIAGANYSKILPEQRTELLRVAQKLIVATISFIFFAALLSLSEVGGSVDPNILPSSSLGVVKLILFWLAVGLFFSGTGLFVLGVIDLAIGLKNLKEKGE